MRNRILLFILSFFCLQKNAVNCKEKKKASPVNSDLPYIACSVCERLAKELYQQIEQLRADAPYKKLEEIQVIETLDGVCKEDEKPGEWIRRQDVVEHLENGKARLELAEPGGVSKCGSECATISKSCSSFLEDEIDKDDLSALLWKGKQELKDLQVTFSVFSVSQHMRLISFFRQKYAKR